MRNTKQTGGIITDILIIIVILIVLGYFGFNINNIINSPTVSSNLQWLGNIFLTIWSWISAPVLWAWHLITSLFQAGVNNIPQQ